MNRRVILTIGHSTHTLEEFQRLLRVHSVTALADVRSSPYSRFTPDFNREPLAASLQSVDIKYVFMGDVLGGRSRNAGDYEDGRVQYSRMASSPLFGDGIDRVIAGAIDYRIALLCAEKDPLDCHRTLLVSRELDRRGVAVEHVHADGRLESNDSATARLLAMYGMQEDGLFDGRDQLIDRAILLHARKIAYVDPQMRAAAAIDSP